MGDVVPVCKKKEKNTNNTSFVRNTEILILIWGPVKPCAMSVIFSMRLRSQVESLQTDKWFSGIQSESFNYDVLGVKPPKDVFHVITYFLHCQPRLWKVSAFAQILASSCETHRSNQCRRPSFYNCGCLPLHCVWSLEELLWRKSFTSCLWKADCLVKSQCSLTNAWVKVLMHLILNVSNVFLWQWIYKLKWN